MLCYRKISRNRLSVSSRIKTSFHFKHQRHSHFSPWIRSYTSSSNTTNTDPRKYPLWIDRVSSHSFQSFPRLDDIFHTPPKFDVAVIGTSITGLNSALNLKRKGYSVIVIERKTIGNDGAEYGSGSFHMFPFELSSFSELRKHWSFDQMRMLAQSMKRARTEILDHIQEGNISCDLSENVPGYLLITERELNKNRKKMNHETRMEMEKWIHNEFQVAKEIGLDPTMIKNRDLDSILSSFDFNESFREHVKRLVSSSRDSSPLGMMIPGQIQLNPLKYALGLAQLIHEDSEKSSRDDFISSRIVENTLVHSIDHSDPFLPQGKNYGAKETSNPKEKDSPPHFYRVKTDRGDVLVDSVVEGTTIPLGRHAVDSLIAPYQSHFIATQLKNYPSSKNENKDHFRNAVFWIKTLKNDSEFDQYLIQYYYNNNNSKNNSNNNNISDEQKSIKGEKISNDKNNRDHEITNNNNNNNNNNYHAQPFVLINGENIKFDENETEAIDRLKNHAKELINMERVEYMWSSRNYYSVDRVPFVSRFPLLKSPKEIAHQMTRIRNLRNESRSRTFESTQLERPLRERLVKNHGVYYTTGMGNNELMWGTCCGSLMADLISGTTNNLSDVMKPSRLMRRPDLSHVKSMLSETFHFGRTLVKDRFQVESGESIFDMPVDHGAVVAMNGQRVAVYRDESAAFHFLSPVCTHMRCYVHWNRNEKTWDCPCHGARYDGYGKRLSGPQLEDLHRLDDNNNNNNNNNNDDDNNNNGGNRKPRWRKGFEAMPVKPPPYFG